MHPEGYDRQVVVVDTETTGLGHAGSRPRPDGVVQVGYAWRDGDGEVRRWAKVCNPGRVFLAGGRAAGALRVNGLTVDHVLASPPAAEVAAEFRARLDSISETTGRPVEVRAFNRRFDEPFLRDAPWRVGTDRWGPCVMERAARAVYGSRARRIKLQDAVAAVVGAWPDGPAHDAAVDAHAALLVDEALASVSPRTV